MLDDIILTSPVHFEKSSIILNSINKENIILIYGSSGTGKSEIGMCLRQQLYRAGKTSFVISLDDYYTSLWHEREKIRKKKGIGSINLREIRWDVIKTTLNNFKRKQPMPIWRINKCAKQLETVVIDSTKIDIIIIEGLFSGYLKKFKKSYFAVYLEGNPKQTLEFRQIRLKENPNSKFRSLVVEKEYKIVQQLKRYNDIVIPYSIGEENES